MKNRRGFLSIRSRHPSHDAIKGQIPHDNAVIRFGSVTETNHEIQLNLPDAIRNSMNKLRMKQLFKEVTEHTPEYWESHESITEEHLPVLAKRAFRSRGAGMRKLNTLEEFNEFIQSNRYQNNSEHNPYYFEKYHNYAREYRLHISENGCFYACRKMLREDADNRWFRNDQNCVWFTEYEYQDGVYNTEIPNEGFNKPQTWNLIVDECHKCLDSIGLDIGAFDVLVATNGRFKILEINSAPSFGDLTTDRYIIELKKILNV